MKRTFAGLAMLLAACGQDSTPDDPGSSRSGQTDIPPPATSSGSSGATVGKGPRSEYTRFALDACRQTEWIEEGASGAWDCPGYHGIELVALTGDGRFDLDAGEDNRTFESITPFNDIADTVEWRLAPDGRPFAIIYRLRTATPEVAPRSVLFVETVPAGGKPSCLLARIGGAVPDANVRAREAADGAAGGIDCAGHTPLALGEAR